MAIFGSTSWTGRSEITSLIEGKPPLISSKPMPKKVTVTEGIQLQEYAELAALVGVRSPEMAVENFKAFLVKHDIPVYNLQTVIDYMDDKAEKESKNKSGWEWKPLREKDHLTDVRFGTRPNKASDYYQGPVTELLQYSGSSPRKTLREPLQSVYGRTIPLHALRKVALIEKEYKEPVSFFVSDYAPELKIVEYPDPFLMAVINNPRLHKNEGRFIIDFWDEPGFGLEQQLK